MEKKMEGSKSLSRWLSGATIVIYRLGFHLFKRQNENASASKNKGSVFDLKEKFWATLQ